MTPAAILKVSKNVKKIMKFYELHIFTQRWFHLTNSILHYFYPSSCSYHDAKIFIWLSSTIKFWRDFELVRNGRKWPKLAKYETKISQIWCFSVVWPEISIGWCHVYTIIIHQCNHHNLLSLKHWTFCDLSQNLIFYGI